ncbi:hypothetical protein [Variovorax saccharolyticus]|uniref:hypothetical protein n=1 Tax=Variovorax saccharolyticus TaxID=3053516 RepID=UPI00257676D7|nr:hypothetical protein [Variovorax sp. J22R187]MDM0022178.1 hypothetical protein [Variovorax sp. J22R187]
MKFTEYVIVEKTGVLIDPLGFLKPSRDLQDLIFEQFTVLTHHPSYHGMLCAASQWLGAKGHQPDSTGYARRFRRLEIVWGLMNAAMDQPILNVRKYQQLGAESVRLAAIPTGHPIFQKLAYGTLGHYRRPSIAWGLLDPKGRALTASGTALARGFSCRHGQDLDAILSRWENGDAFQSQDLARGGQAFHLHAEPSTKERAAWRGVIDAWTAKRPETAPVWADPVPISRLDAFQASPGAYCAQYDWLADRYPSLGAQVGAIHTFERLSGAIQFVFDRRLAALAFDAPASLQRYVADDTLADAIVDLAAKTTRHDAGRLFATLAVTKKRFADVEAVIVQHHTAHQRAKGVSPYFDASGVLVKDKVAPAEVAEVMEDLEALPDVERQLDRLQYRSRRDWHFRRCTTYHAHAWAGGHAA